MQYFQLLLVLAVVGLSQSLVLNRGMLSSRRLSATTGLSSSALRAEKKKEEGSNSGVRQLMGIKGAAETKNIWAIRLQLCKPVTWIPLIWGVACGAAASGNYHTWNPFSAENAPTGVLVEDALKAFVCMILAGPILTGYTQTLNDWEDREIDAINEPYRPIPSGAISKDQVIGQIWFLLLSGVALAYGLDQWAGHADPIITELTIFGSFISYIYSAPPLKLKATGWAGSFALGSSYISLPWLCGQALFGELSWPVTVLTVFYSLAGLGIAIVNDFKSIEGDRALGLQSLPVAFGIEKAKWLTVGTIDITQLLVAAYLFYIQETTYGLVLLGLIAPQMFFQYKFFLPDPIKNDVKYQAAAQPFLVFGILATAMAVGNHGPL
ncbi:bacteriochlorophyll/chlorophyll a synthase [Ochromonadaceae sp. CCMP2298]|nr:bacteriochlorophyll/chlorophyll a synthase [Ochromonadaceae sp. CCMP2298]